MSESTVRLYNGPFAVSMGERGGHVRPGQAVLFSMDDGHLVHLSRTPSMFQALKYRYRYEVDLGDHTVSWVESLPSGTGGFPFQARFEARWRVTEPTEVVLRQMATRAAAQSEVMVAMRTLLWPHTAAYGIEHLQDLENSVRANFCARAHHLPIGITVDALVVRLYLDDQAIEYLRAKKQAQFDEDLIRATHGVRATTQVLEAELQRQREEALLAAARGEGGLLVHLIAQDPTKLHEIMSELGRRQDIATEQKQQTLKEMITAGLIQPAEAHQMWFDMHRPAPLFEAGEIAPAAGQASPSLTAAQPGAPVGMLPGSPVGGATQQPPPVSGLVVNQAPATAPPRPRHRPGAGQGGVPSAVPEPADEIPAVSRPLLAPDMPLPVPEPSGPVPDEQLAPQVSPDPSAPGWGSANVTGATPVGRRRDTGSEGATG